MAKKKEGETYTVWAAGNQILAKELIRHCDEKIEAFFKEQIKIQEKHFKYVENLLKIAVKKK